MKKTKSVSPLPKTRTNNKNNSNNTTANKSALNKKNIPNPKSKSNKNIVKNPSRKNSQETNRTQTDSGTVTSIKTASNIDETIRQNRFQCFVCQKPAITQCSKCEEFYYCGVQHQKLDYENHEGICNRLYLQKKHVDHIDQKPNLNRIRSLDQDINDGFNIEEIALRADVQEYMESIPLEGYKVFIENLEEFLVKLRQKKRTECILNLGRENFSISLLSLKELVNVSRNLFSLNKEKYFYSYIIDNLQMAKLYIKQNKVQFAYELLLMCFSIFNSFLNESKYKVFLGDVSANVDIAEVNEIQIEFQQVLNENFTDTKKTDALVDQYKIRANLIMLRELKRRSALLSCLGSLFFNVGDFKHAESCYILYTKLIEMNFGADSLEASNCYFLVGVFYLENRYLKRSIACFMKSKDVRTQNLGYDHLSVSDCHFNIAFILTLTNDLIEAKKVCETTLELRIRSLGENHITIPKCIELLGIINYKEGNLSLAKENLKHAIEMKKSFYKNDKFYEVEKTMKILEFISFVPENTINNNTDRSIPNFDFEWVGASMKSQEKHRPYNEMNNSILKSNKSDSPQQNEKKNRKINFSLPNEDQENKLPTFNLPDSLDLSKSSLSGFNQQNESVDPRKQRPGDKFVPLSESNDNIVLSEIRDSDKKSNVSQQSVKEAKGLQNNRIYELKKRLDELDRNISSDSKTLDGDERLKKSNRSQEENVSPKERFQNRFKKAKQKLDAKKLFAEEKEKDDEAKQKEGSLFNLHIEKKPSEKIIAVNKSVEPHAGSIRTISDNKSVKFNTNLTDIDMLFVYNGKNLKDDEKIAKKDLSDKKVPDLKHPDEDIPIVTTKEKKSTKAETKIKDIEVLSFGSFRNVDNDRNKNESKKIDEIAQSNNENFQKTMEIVNERNKKKNKPLEISKEPDTFLQNLDKSYKDETRKIIDKYRTGSNRSNEFSGDIDTTRENQKLYMNRAKQKLARVNSRRESDHDDDINTSLTQDDINISSNEDAKDNTNIDASNLNLNSTKTGKDIFVIYEDAEQEAKLSDIDNKNNSNIFKSTPRDLDNDEFTKSESKVLANNFGSNLSERVELNKKNIVESDLDFNYDSFNKKKKIDSGSNPFYIPNEGNLLGKKDVTKITSSNNSPQLSVLEKTSMGTSKISNSRVTIAGDAFDERAKRLKKINDARKQKRKDEQDRSINSSILEELEPLKNSNENFQESPIRKRIDYRSESPLDKISEASSYHSQENFSKKRMVDAVEKNVIRSKLDREGDQPKVLKLSGSYNRSTDFDPENNQKKDNEVKNIDVPVPDSKGTDTDRNRNRDSQGQKSPESSKFDFTLKKSKDEFGNDQAQGRKLFDDSDVKRPLSKLDIAQQNSKAGKPGENTKENEKKSPRETSVLKSRLDQQSLAHSRHDSIESKANKFAKLAKNRTEQDAKLKAAELTAKIDQNNKTGSGKGITPEKSSKKKESKLDKVARAMAKKRRRDNELSEITMTQASKEESRMSINTLQQFGEDEILRERNFMKYSSLLMETPGKSKYESEKKIYTDKISPNSFKLDLDKDLQKLKKSDDLNKKRLSSDRDRIKISDRKIIHDTKNPLETPKNDTREVSPYDDSNKKLYDSIEKNMSNYDSESQVSSKSNSRKSKSTKFDKTLAKQRKARERQKKIESDKQDPEKDSINNDDGLQQKYSMFGNTTAKKKPDTTEDDKKYDSQDIKKSSFNNTTKNEVIFDSMPPYANRKE